mmetsp:Transcript_17757/g.27978  ORF Transcript_17757/g.27978 Transcript_17757/m.27978 type:complete len:400 (-) Transcript_17757:40-1239(-)|eukprot:CAMPEP_0194726424 /NCGR_PEP_ID=MMETSP0296-20130528/31241_1 /TAXON_ID=39354 /ORGANISM="Heterosigma akashiwo, Strain CCMP2393" /LENGTH=399 /DNA_ID=CAMNT_0039631407 /DNA_START=55 /DNA_END=1254 /DNA_ORIENTATION=+
MKMLRSYGLPGYLQGAVIAMFFVMSQAFVSLFLASSSKSNHPGTSPLRLAMSSPLTEGVLDRRTALVGFGSLAGLSSFGYFPRAEAMKEATNRKFPEWELSNAVRMPLLALNTVALDAKSTELALELAVKEGFTHVDFHPGQERDGVAQYISSDPSRRDHLFLTTKIRKAKPGTSPADAADLARAQIDEDLRILNVRQVDMLMLRDSPDCEVMQSQWAVMEEALAAGKTRSVGVVNFCQGALECLLETASVKPAVNYYMLHVGMGPDAHGLRPFCESRGIRTFAYGAVGEPGPNKELLNSPVLKRIGERHGKSPEEVALRWGIQGGSAVSVRPTTNFGLGSGVCSDKNDCGAGLKKRAGVFGWSLSQKDMTELDAMTGPDDNPTLFSSAGCPGAFQMPK